MRRGAPFLAATFVVGGALAVLWPLIKGGYPAGKDALPHLFRLYLLEAAFREGIWLPRWSPDLLFGYGYALFNFYSPLFYYLATIPRSLGSGVAEAMTITTAASVLLAAGGAFALCKALYRSAHAGVLGAVAFGTAPYLLHNVFLRTALAELLAMALLPWIFWSLLRLRSGRARFVPVTALATAGLVLSHNPTAMLGLAFAVLWALSLLLSPVPGGVPGPAHRLRCGSLMALAFLAGLGLSAFFWLPAVAEIDATRLPQMGVRGEFLDLLRHAGAPLDDQLLYSYPYNPRLGLWQTVLALAGGLGALAFGPRGGRIFVLSLLATLILALSLMTPWATDLWGAIPLITAMSFPWRVLSVASLSTAVLGAGLAGVGTSWLRAVLMSLGAAASIGTAAGALSPTFLQLDDSSVNSLWLARFEAGSSFPGTTSPTQFMPLLVSERVEALREPPKAPSPGHTDLIPREVRLLETSPLVWDLQVSGPPGGRLRLHQQFFPGWSAATEQGPAAVTAEGPRGLATIALPEGSTRLRLWFGETPVRAIATWISWGSLTALTLAPLMVWVRRISITPTRAPFLARVVAALAIAVPALLLAIGALRARPAPTPVEGTRLDFGAGLHLVGWQTDWRPLRSDGAVRLNLYWYVSQAPVADYLVELTLVDADGTSLAQTRRRPFFGTAPTGWWERGELVRDSQWLPLPAGLPAGDYHLSVRLIDAGTGAALEPSGEGPALLALALPAPAPSTIESADFASSLARLTGGIHLVDWSGDRRLVAGKTAPIQLKWGAERELEEDYAVSVQLLDRDGTLRAQQDSYPPEHLRLTSAWLPGRAVRETYLLAVPQDLPTGAYDLVAKMYRQQDLSPLEVVDRQGRSGSVFPLARVKVVGRKEALAAPRRPVEAQFGQFARLAGLDGLPAASAAAARVPPGGTLAFALRWQATGTTDRDYRIFVHLADATGRVVAQIDREPQGRRFPTSFWEAGEEIRDPVSLSLPLDLSPGRYRLLVGLYDPASGARVPVSPETPSHALLVGEVEVAPF